MEPKDMTRELSKQSDLSLMMRIRDLDIPRGTYWGNPIITELLRRLNEADALRKENEELRNAHAKLLKDYAELRVNSALLVACDDALESLDSSEASQPAAKCASLSEGIDRIKSEDGRAK